MQTAVKSTLETYFRREYANTSFSSIAVHYSSSDFDTSRSNRWLRFSVVPLSAQRISIGDRNNSDVENSGEVVMNLFYPTNDRFNTIYAFSDEVSRIFDRAAICVNSSVTVYFEAPIIAVRPDTINKDQIDIRCPYRYYSR